MNRFACWRYSRVILILDLALVLWNVVAGFRLHDAVYFVVAIWVLVALQLIGQLQITREARDQARKDRADAVDAHYASLDRITASIRNLEEKA